ncbi:MAG: CRISPR-associated helicase Cas3' [Zoogloeaceae bacterium]|nr:CRISPR-associated helicase Cas3' [Zoogloeaceae bacterium]
MFSGREESVIQNDLPNYFHYWGKAKPESKEPYHLLVFHALDVAACGRLLVRLPQFSLRHLAGELGWTDEQVENLFVFFLALHDLGKFARAFQGLVKDISPDLVRPVAGKIYNRRHDTLGWLCWREWAADILSTVLPRAGDECWAVWMRSATGHHGQPPEEVAGGGLTDLIANDYFVPEDCQAVGDYMVELANWLSLHAMPAPTRATTKILRRYSWRLAGLAVLADWLGSNQTFFPYRSRPTSDLQTYWREYALPQAEAALSVAGLQPRKPRHWSNPLALFDHLREPTPLQHYANEVTLQAGPQVFLLEDVTGAGKTEAALILTQRLMQAGLAQGLYFALPSMATANQMYQRIGAVYRRLFTEDSQPSLVLAHGARALVQGFRDSILQTQAAPADHNYAVQDGTATTQCNAWLADNQKKAFLADVGVGTLDQALLAVMPVRFQSLRLLGLADKILLVDEVHGYDPYMLTLLKRLLTAHARQGGSAILLSATLPLSTRQELLSAFRLGLGKDELESLPDQRYPLAIHAGQEVMTHACATRPLVKRRVEVRGLHREDEVHALLIEQARSGHCVCWIRNTVEDARRAYAALAEQLGPECSTLFHSRYAMGHRLDIEARVLRDFGKHSTSAARHGKVLIGTQVLQESLDFCVDVMVSDLAPIELLIQRAGRLQRHARERNGDPAADGIEHRAPPVLYVLMPEMTDAPADDWYSSLFPKACYVYPDAGKLWLGARALLAAGCLVSPGESAQPGAVRELVEAAYGQAAEQIPDALQRATQKQLGKDLAMQSQGAFNALNLDKGYCIESSGRWYEDGCVPTRLGDETVTLYLARKVAGELRPLCDDEHHSWELSAVRVRDGIAEALAPQWRQRFASTIQNLRSRYRLLEEPAFIVPLVEADGGLKAYVIDASGREREMLYNIQDGLTW